MQTILGQICDCIQQLKIDVLTNQGGTWLRPTTNPGTVAKRKVICQSL